MASEFTLTDDQVGRIAKHAADLGLRDRYLQLVERVDHKLIVDDSFPEFQALLYPLRDTIPADRIKQECGRLIGATLSDSTQKNFNAYAADLALKDSLSTAEQADVDTMRAARGWVLAMVQESRDAIAAKRAPSWPNVPPGVAELAARF